MVRAVEHAVFRRFVALGDLREEIKNNSQFLDTIFHCETFLVLNS